ncbi:MAG: alpha/beta hydrolase [Anaerolineaceae bacterium]|nr:alpha/beta hydrolase [Anaerolineaceae bacterium]
MSAIYLEKRIIHYETLGRGRPILFLHGWLGSWRYWVSAMQATTINFRSYALDFWGFGDSSKDPGQYSCEAQTELIRDFINQLGIGKVAVIGHGLGALIGLLFAEKYADLVDRIILVSLPGQEQGLLNEFERSDLIQLTRRLIGDHEDLDAILFEVSKTDPTAIQKIINEIQENNISRMLRDIEKPSLLVSGKNDPLISFPEKVDYSAMVHQITLDESGHFPMLQEKNKFNRLMVDFLTLPPKSSLQDLQLKEEWKRRVR